MTILLMSKRSAPEWRQLVVKLLIMKLSVIIILATSLQVMAKNVRSQSIALDVKDAPLKEVLANITRQTGYHFVYTAEQLAASAPVTIKVENADLEAVLVKCFKQQPLEFIIKSNLKQVVILMKQEEDVSPVTPLATGDVEGHILNEKGEPLQGATVAIKGSKTQVETDIKGAFLLHGVATNSVLIITYVGYTAREITVEAAHPVTITLSPSFGQLDQTMIIAYGTTTQRYSIGSVSKVTSDDIMEQPVLNPIAALQGRVPGLDVTSTSGVPGASFKIQIRGQNTINTNNSIPVPMDNPLFIVDGVPVTAQNDNINQYASLASPGANALYNNPYGGISPFNSINPADIESIEVLRDADATAIYGSRGANGVILITTKHGKPGKTRFGGSFWTGINKVTNSVPMMTTQQYLAARHEGFNNDGIIPDASNAADLVVYDTTSYTNWKKTFLGGTAHSTDANAYISGGTGNTQFLLGSGFHRETYIFPGDFSYNRASFNGNLHHVSTDQKLVIDFTVNYSYDQNNSSGSPSALSAFTLVPDHPALLNPDGSINWTYKGVDLSDNPLSYLKQKYLDQNNNLLGHLQLGYQFFPGFTIRSSLGFNTLRADETSQVPIGAQDPSTNPLGSVNFGTRALQTWIIEPQAEYKKNLFNGRIDILAGGTFQKNTNKSTSIAANNYTNDALLGSIAAAGSTVSTDGYSLYKYNAFFGRLNYVMANKYIVDLTGRRDGSSRFGPGKQFGNFGSVGGGWLFSEERFVKENLRSLTYGKLRATYGSSGTDNIGDYQYIANWQGITPPFQGSAGYYPTNLYNPNFSWAVNKKLEGGLELGFFSDKLLLSAAYFRNRCGDQLVNYNLPAQTGFNNVTQNFPAIVQNTGWEIQMSSTNIKTKSFTWSTTLNLTIPKNKLLSYPGLATSSYSYSYVVGKSLSVIQAYRFAGVNDTTGYFQFYSNKGAATINPTYPDDRVIMGNTDPKFYGGFRNSFTYKNFQVDIFMEFKKQTGVDYLYSIYSGNSPGAPINSPAIFAGPHWQKLGDQATIQRFSSGSDYQASVSAYNLTQSSAAYADASYIRFKTLSISYSLSRKYISKIGMDGCRIYINAQNLFTITPYKIGDPETQSIYSIPPVRVIVAGLQFNF